MIYPTARLVTATTDVEVIPLTKICMNQLKLVYN